MRHEAPKTPVGNYDIWFNDIAIVGTNGSVFPIYHREPSVSTNYYSSGGMTNTAIAIQTPVDAATVDQGLTTTTYYQGDHLGSTRVLTAAEGWPVATETYYPFGPEQTVPADPNHYKFTGKERDAESGLDNFGARYVSSNLGRFMSPDWAVKADAVPYADLDDPQSLNLYVYVRNNPLSSVDADGHNSFTDFFKNLWQRTNNALHGLGFNTNQQVEQNIHDAQQWLRNNSSFTPEQLETATDKQILDAAHDAQAGKSSAILGNVKYVLKVVSALPGGARSPKNPEKLTNPPQNPPSSEQIPAGWRVRYGPPNAQAPNGHWRLEKPMDNGGWQGIDPSTMKPGSPGETHIPLLPPSPQE